MTQRTQTPAIWVGRCALQSLCRPRNGGARLNILLVLSALLSAFGGMATHGRAALAPAALSRSVAEASAASHATPVATFRPAQRIAALHDVAGAPVVAALPLAAREPIFASRRRE